MAPVALFGIENDGFGIAANLLVIFLIAVWFALVFWTYNDARRRIDDSVLVSAAAFAALVFPFAGALVYAIVRPPETLDDRYERELDIRAAELRVRMLEQAQKSGSGSAAHASAVAGELSGEPGARRASGGRESKSPPARKAPAPGGSERADRTPAAARQERASERSAQRTSERPAAPRPAQAAKPPAERPPRRPSA